MKVEKLTYDQIVKYGIGKRGKVLFRLRRKRLEIMKYKLFRTPDGMYRADGVQGCGCCGAGKRLVLRPIDLSKIDSRKKTFDVVYLVI